MSFAGHRFHEANHTGLLPELPPIVANHSTPDLPPEIPREVFQPLIDILQTSQGNDELMSKLNARTSGSTAATSPRTIRCFPRRTKIFRGNSRMRLVRNSYAGWWPCERRCTVTRRAPSKLRSAKERRKVLLNGRLPWKTTERHKLPLYYRRSSVWKSMW